MKEGASNADAAEDILCRTAKAMRLHQPPLVIAITPTSYLLTVNGLRMSLRGEGALYASTDWQVSSLQYLFHVIFLQHTLTCGIGIGNENHCKTHTYGSGRIAVTKVAKI